MQSPASITDTQRMPAPTAAVPLVLASRSPRRRALIALLDAPSRSIDIAIDERAAFVDTSPADGARRAAELKADAGARHAATEEWVVAADTIVVLDNRVFGKPADGRDALAMLRALRGRHHRVMTGVAVRDAGGARRASTVVASTVQMAAASDLDIESYARSTEPLDKAGAYAFQGAGRSLVATVEGCVANVVGLPVCTVAALLALARMVGSPAVVAGACDAWEGGGCPARSLLDAMGEGHA